MKLIIYIVILILIGCSHNSKHNSKNVSTLTDESKTVAKNSFAKIVSYKEALKSWKSPKDISVWIGSNFSYDMNRAMTLSETQRSKKKKLSFYTAKEFFDKKTGVCVDLSNFAYKTLKSISPHLRAKFLMIKFDPIKIKGNILRMHWLTSFKMNGKYYFFADSKRPGTIKGPYNTPNEFISEYEQFRQRKIVSFKLLDSFKKKKKRRKKIKKTK